MEINIDKEIDAHRCPTICFCTVATTCYEPIEREHKCYTTGAIKDGKMEFATKTTNYTKGHWKSTSYTTDKIDVFFLYCAENNWCGLYIPSEGAITQSLTIRLEPPKK